VKCLHPFWLVFALCGTLSADPVLLVKSPFGLRDPTSADVATQNGVKQIALQWWLVNGGIDAQEGVVVDGKFSAARPIKGFASPGDVIWEVRFILSIQSTVTGVLWINQKTGKVKALR